LAGVTAPVEPPGRPVDVDTGFWLWVASLPLLATGHIVDLIVTANEKLPAPVLAISVLFVLIVAAVVLTFQILMRHGYRWARTLLTGGGVATIVYVATNLFTADRPTAAAVTYAVSSILGTVLIAGGVFLLHRKDAHAFFTR
jgi:drug/metabolite transporter (DMT)-like permease